MTFRQSSFEQEGMESTGSFSGTFEGDFTGTLGSFTGVFTGAYSGDTEGTSSRAITASSADVAAFAISGTISEIARRSRELRPQTSNPGFWRIAPEISGSVTTSNLVVERLDVSGSVLGCVMLIDSGTFDVQIPSGSIQIPSGSITAQVVIESDPVLDAPIPIVSGTFVTNAIRAHYQSDIGVLLGPSGTVTAWLDQSGFGEDLTQSLSDTQEPSFIDTASSAFQRLPAIRFDGIDDYLHATLSANLTGSGLVPHAGATTIGMLVRHLDKVANFAGIASFARSGSDDFTDPGTFVIQLADNDFDWQVDRNSVTHRFKKYRNRAPQAVVIVIDGDDVDVWQSRRLDTFTDVETVLNVEHIILGARKSAVGPIIADFGHVEFAEFIVYDVAMNPNEVEELLRYLEARTGMAF